MSKAEELEIQIEKTTDGVIVRPVGDVDLGCAPTLRQRLKEVQNENPERLVIDLSAVPYMDSSGVGSLVEALVRAKHRGRRFSLVSAHPATLRALRLARLDEVFTVHETLEGAAQARRAAVS